MPWSIIAAAMSLEMSRGTLTSLPASMLTASA